MFEPSRRGIKQNDDFFVLISKRFFTFEEKQKEKDDDYEPRRQYKKVYFLVLEKSKTRIQLLGPVGPD
jgi:hypothetical protein